MNAPASAEMTVVPGTCKFCQAPLVIELDPVGIALWVNPDALLALASCDRCADYRTRCSALLGATNAILTTSRMRNGADPERTHNMILKLFKAWCEHVDHFYRVQIPFSESIIPEIAKAPEKMRNVMIKYAIGARAISRAKDYDRAKLYQGDNENP